jgi:hypothetical protein
VRTPHSVLEQFERVAKQLDAIARDRSPIACDRAQAMLRVMRTGGLVPRGVIGFAEDAIAIRVPTVEGRGACFECFSDGTVVAVTLKHEQVETVWRVLARERRKAVDRIVAYLNAPADRTRG